MENFGISQNSQRQRYTIFKLTTILFFECVCVRERRYFLFQFRCTSIDF